MSVLTRLKRLLIGKPIPTKHAHRERLSVLYGLPVFASDALSSVAYASEEILLVLVMAGAAALHLVFPVSLFLALLMLVVGFSYYQTIHAYPAGGGTYLVTTENLGTGAGLIAGAALMIDYVLTVAVSVSSGVAAIVSMFPQSQIFNVWIGIGAVAIICLANLRGVRESGTLFALPTYSFVVLILALVLTCLARGLGKPPIPPPEIIPPADGWHAVNAFLILRAFAASCTAMTGTEAIADGVQAFQPPEVKNAAKTLVAMIALLLAMFIGISWSAWHYGIVPMHADQSGYKTVVAQLAQIHFDGGPFFYLLLGATTLILFLAANTAFADFPRLSSFIARDGFMPRQLTAVGDRLVFQNGIILLALAAIGLIVLYGADTHSLIPLYALGVFISFTMSQSGMFVKQLRSRAAVIERESKASGPNRALGVLKIRLLLKAVISGFGGIVTGIVTLILLFTKWTEGAWLIVVALAFMMLVFMMIKRHYNYLAGELSLTPDDKLPKIKTTVLLLAPRLHKGILQAIAYAKAITKDVRAVHVTLDPKSTGAVKRDWARFGADIPLVILEGPHRSLVEPIVEYIEMTLKEDPNLMVTVIIPQAVPKRWYHSLLHNNAVIPLRIALTGKKNVVITSVRYFLQ